MRKACQQEGLPNCLQLTHILEKNQQILEENSECQVNENGETCFVTSVTVIGNPKIGKPYWMDIYRCHPTLMRWLK